MEQQYSSIHWQSQDFKSAFIELSKAGGHTGYNHAFERKNYAAKHYICHVRLKNPTEDRTRKMAPATCQKTEKALKAARTRACIELLQPASASNPARLTTMLLK